MAELESVSMFGCNIYSGTYNKLIEKIRYDILHKKRNVVFAINPRKVTIANKDSNVDKVLKSSDILIPDGTGIIYAAKKKNLKIEERITGIDLMYQVCRLSVDIDSKIFIYGASQENLEKAVINLRDMFPGINIVDYINGYEKNEEYVNMRINESKADILFVACGSPEQEIYINANKDKLPDIKFLLGVGGSVDVISGNVKRAPEWIRKFNLEWLYRMVSQPRRIFHIKEILKFLILL